MNGPSCQRGSEKLIFQPIEDWIAKEEGKSEASSFPYLFLSLCFLSSLWARLTGGSACPLGCLERRSGVCVCVCFGVYTFTVAATDFIRAVNT